MAETMSGFKRSFAISLALHAGVVALVVFVINYHPTGIHLPSMDSKFAHAIAISLLPHPHPQPKPQVKPTPHIPKPQPATVETQAVQASVQTPPPAQKPTPPEMPQPEEQPETQANPDYEQYVMQVLNDVKRYPKEAVLAGTEGQAVLYLVVNSQGTVLAYRIEQSSGSDVLDQEVVAMVHKARFPPFPAGDNAQRKEFTIPIEFSLSNRDEN